ncbi:MAG: hypothetical protein JOY57_08960 [Actinobacteria bacterium]|nr:hypothetical protein [Actinomycetota bacterium]
MLRRLAMAAALLASPLLMAGAVHAAQTSPSVTWESWLKLKGVFDLQGPRKSDGKLVAAALGNLKLVGVDGGVTDFAPGYDVPIAPESYIALSPGLTVDSAGCAFEPDEVFALDQQRLVNPNAQAQGITRISADGTRISRFATIDGTSSLNSIAFDTGGQFEHRLLVTGILPSAGVTPGQPAPPNAPSQVYAIDCRGVVTKVGPPVDKALEGGAAIAPASFGPFGGDLIVPNENDGAVYAINPQGRLQKVVDSGLPAGGDTGVESLGFIPPSGATRLLVSDRGTPGSPHPGTETVLRLQAAALDAAGVLPDDLIVVTEASGTAQVVHCASTCSARTFATGPAPGHIEGHVIAIAKPLKASSDWGGLAIIAGVLVVAGIVLLVGVRLRLRGTRRPRGSSRPS